MRLRDAIEMLADSGVEALGQTTWADLGCGEGTFTLALADVLAAGSTIHAMDRNGSAVLTKNPRRRMAVIGARSGLRGVIVSRDSRVAKDVAAFIRQADDEQRTRSSDRT